MQKKYALHQQLYTLAFVILSVKNVLDSSQLIHRPDWMDNLFVLSFFALIGWKFMLQRYTKPMLFGTMFFGAIFAFVSFRMSYFFLLFTFCGLAALQNVDLKKVLRYTSITKILMILLHVIPYLVMKMISPEQVEYVWRNGVRREFFYIGHPNTFSMYVGWAILEFTFAFYEQLRVIHLIGLWFVNYIVYQYTDSNTSIMVATIVLSLFILDRTRPKLTAKIVTPIARYGYAVCAVFFTVITIWFTSMPAPIKQLYLQLNDFFTGRLLFGSFAYEYFGIAWIGNPAVRFPGKRFFEGFWVDSLVFDNTYIYLLVYYGAIFLPIFSIAFLWLGKDKERNPARNLEKILIIAYTFFAIMENYANNAVLCFPVLFVGQKIFVEYEKRRAKKREERLQALDKMKNIDGVKYECDIKCGNTCV